MFKITIIGTITQDIIHLPDRTKTESFGGISYNLLALSYLNPRNARIYPICNLGEDIYEKALSLLRKRKNIITKGVKKSKGKNNEVRLFCRKSGKRKEFLLGLAPPLNFAQIKPYLDSDIILINFISGFDLSLKTLERIRRNTKRPIFIDIHSLTLGIRKNGERFQCKPKLWKRYLKCADILQMNWEELLVLSDKKIKNKNQTRKWGEKILKSGPKVLIITLGKGGAFIIYGEDGKIKYHLSPAKLSKTVDTVGCGDVFTSAFISSWLQRKDFKFSLDFANRVAGFKAGFSGTNNTKKLSRFAF